MKRRKIWSILALAALTGSLLAGCGEVKTEEQTKETKQEEKPVELLVAAAASLEYSYEEELLPMFEKENPIFIVLDNPRHNKQKCPKCSIQIFQKDGQCDVSVISILKSEKDSSRRRILSPVLNKETNAAYIDHVSHNNLDQKQCQCNKQ